MWVRRSRPRFPLPCSLLLLLLRHEVIASPSQATPSSVGSGESVSDGQIIAQLSLNKQEQWGKSPVRPNF